MHKIAFGPVPSRRLGRSMGINNIPAKICSYNCVYCQLGKTIRQSTARREYYSPEEIADEVLKAVERAENRGEPIDYLTFVPDGEPTLDINLGKEAKMLKSSGIPIAIITNSSLLWMEDVLEDLMEMDYISMKLDAFRPDMWKIIDRPANGLEPEKIHDGMLELSKSFKGKLVTETMLVGGVQDETSFFEISEFLAKIMPDTAYISIPTRPPAEEWVKPPSEEILNIAYHVLSKSVKTEFLISYEGDDFSSSGNAETDLLAITSVHPMREDAVKKLLEKDGEGWELVERLLGQKKLVSLEFGGERYIMRRLPGRA